MISLRSKISQKILNYFMLQSVAEVYGNELARVLDVESGNLTRQLLILENEGILKSRWQGKQRYYSLNKSFPLIKEYKNIVLKTLGLESLLASTLKNIEGIKSAWIFGSYAQDRMDSHSDIDLLVVGEHSTVELQRAIAQVQKSIQREINVVSMSSDEFNAKKSKNSFLMSVEGKKKVKIL